MSDYDKIPAPAKRCENCAHGTMHPEWRDVYRCGLDGGLKDWRVVCASYRQSTHSLESHQRGEKG